MPAGDAPQGPGLPARGPAPGPDRLRVSGASVGAAFILIMATEAGKSAEKNLEFNSVELLLM